MASIPYYVRREMSMIIILLVLGFHVFVIRIVLDIAILSGIIGLRGPLVCTNAQFGDITISVAVTASPVGVEEEEAPVLAYKGAAVLTMLYVLKADVNTAWVASPVFDTLEVWLEPEVDPSVLGQFVQHACCLFVRRRRASCGRLRLVNKHTVPCIGLLVYLLLYSTLAETELALWH